MNGMSGSGRRSKSVTSPLRLVVFLLPSLCLLAQCAARHPAATPTQLADIARAEALVRDGCYRCLRDALGIYTSLTEPPARRPPVQALRGAFDVTLLLAVREKELGLAADASLARARALLPRLSNLSDTDKSQRTQPRETLPARLEAAEAIVGDLSGLDSEERQRRDEASQQTGTAAAGGAAAGGATAGGATAASATAGNAAGGGADAIGRLRDALQESAPADLTAAYLALALECEHPRSRTSIPPASASAQTDAPPLMRYRLATCRSASPTTLTQLREADARWTEAFFFEGKYEMGSPARAGDPARAAALFTSASEAFADSIAIRVLLANAQDMNGEFAAALASFDRILASKPTHVDALLGRVRSLSYLGRTDEGMAAATTLIDLATWHTGDAYYWRAWNAYQARQLEQAWADIRQAMNLLSNTAVYALAGSIAHARRDLDTAVRHFDRAFEIDPSNCLAVWSAGLVHIDQGVWPPAADKFSKASSCFALAARTARAELAKLDQSTLDPAVKARRASSVRKRIESAEELGGQAALNAAQSYVNTGQKQLALAHIALAESHPATRDKALALRPRIDSMP